MNTLKPYLLLSLLCAVLYLPGLCTLPMVDRDEAHFAQATRQMLATGHYFQIRYQTITRFQKPPGINWLQAAAVVTFSQASATAVWPYRLPSVVGALLSVLLTFGFTKRYAGEKVALLAAALLACSTLLTVEAHLAVIDASLLSAMVLMQGALWVIYQDTQRGITVAWQWALVFWLAMSYGFLLKGITPLVGFLTIITLAVVDNHRAWLKYLHWRWGIPLLLVSASWLIGVSIAEHSNYLVQMLHKDLMPKLAGGQESHGLPPGAHLALLTLTLWPTSLFLWQAAVRGWKWRQQLLEKFLLAWIIPSWLFFELMPTKLPQYVLPTFPAIAILAALAIVNSQQTPLDGKHWGWLKVLYGLWGVFSLGLGVSIVILPYSLAQPVSYLSIIIMLLLVASNLVAIIAAFKRHFQLAAWVVILGSVLVYAPFYHKLLPTLKPLWLSQQVADKVKPLIPAHINAQHPLLAVGYQEPSLVFNLGTYNVQFIPFEAIMPWLASHPISYLLIDNSHQAALLQQLALHRWQGVLLATFSGFNYSNGHAVVLNLYHLLKD